MTTAAGAALTAAHRQQQLAIRAATIRDLQILWPSWKGTPQSWDEFTRLASTLVRSRNRDASALAARYFQAFRIAEGAVGSTPVALAAPPSFETLAQSFAITGLRGTLRATAAGFSVQAARANGFALISMSAGRHVMNGARGTLVISTGEDRQARGWQRVTSSEPCDFCEMLAGRGAVYGADTGDFQAHDGCACMAEPRY